MKHLILLLIAACVITACAPTEHCATFDGPDMQALCTAVDAHYMTNHDYFAKDDPNPHYNTGMMTDAVIIESFGKRYAVVNCQDSTVYTCTGCDDALWQEYRDRKALLGQVLNKYPDYEQVIVDERKQIAVVITQPRYAVETAPGVWKVQDRPRDTGADMETVDKLRKLSKQYINTASAE